MTELQRNTAPLTNGVTITGKEHPMQIDFLADHQDFIPILAQWHYREWAHLRPGDSIEARVSRLRACCGRREIPTVVIAFRGRTLIGSAMLVASDMDTRMELSPWLAGVFVVPQYRLQGVGAALVQRIINEVTGLGIERIYLYTPSTERFYSRLGWSLFDRTGYRGAEVALMSYRVYNGNPGENRNSLLWKVLDVCGKGS
jgi:N-acetylglutamate synthase-like GNAT family acetyltransferase